MPLAVRVSPSARATPQTVIRYVSSPCSTSLFTDDPYVIIKPAKKSLSLFRELAPFDIKKTDDTSFPHSRRFFSILLCANCCGVTRYTLIFAGRIISPDKLTCPKAAMHAASCFVVPGAFVADDALACRRPRRHQEQVLFPGCASIPAVAPAVRAETTPDQSCRKACFSTRYKHRPKLSCPPAASRSPWTGSRTPQPS